jgi:ribosomal protein S18 acetylase RimI-like enzyme/DNA-binding transcriptional ArsR family regulator
MDLMTELRELALASRLRRVSDMLMEDGIGLYDDLGIAFRPRWFPTFQALARRSPLAVTELAQTIGVSHPAAVQIAAQLLRAGLVVEVPDGKDDRRRLLALSARGKRVRRRLTPVWTEIRRAANELLAEAGIDLVADLERLEAAHARRSIMDRVRARLELPPRRRLVIADYRPAYKKHFRALNEEWLLSGYEMEPADARLLGDPNGQIIRKGGHILFALLDGQVVGTCALVRYPHGLLELCKMAVMAPRRGRGIGGELAQAAIARARALQVRTLFLQTSPRATQALRFYRRHGFRRARSFPLPRPAYARASVTLKLELDPPGRRPKEATKP